MRKLILAVLAAVVCAGMAGCNMKSGGEYSYSIVLPEKIEETENGVTTATEYEWNSDGSVKARKQTRGTELVYEDGEYTYKDGKITYYRSYYEDGQVASVVRVEEKYLYSNWVGLYSTRFYSEDGGTDKLVERIESIYTEQKQTGYVHEKNGVILVEHDGYQYNGIVITSYNKSGNTVEGRQTVKITYTSYETSITDKIVTSIYGSDTVVSVQKYIYDSAGYKGYKIYKGETEDVIEEQTDYKSESGKTSYTTIWYDDTGAQTRKVATVQNTIRLSIKVTY